MALAGPRLVECGTNRAGSLTTSRPCGPTFTHRETERAGLRVAENGAGRAAGSTPMAPSSCTDKPGQMAGSEADHITQGSSAYGEGVPGRGKKPQTSDGKSP